MVFHPIHLFALLGVGFGFSRAVDTGKEALFLSLLAPCGVLWSHLFP
ncbi:MAG: hypothetical protein R3F56_17195 [Planctomycetota bacterium]